MNYLAHAYLSFGDPQVITGNLISDFVKGRKKYEYPARILAGIELHRAIDDFTDQHAVNKEVSKIFKPLYGLYSSAFLDIVYDHFVALEIADGNDRHLYNFSVGIYAAIEPYTAILPSSFNNLFPYMKQHNWLYNYQFSQGIQRSMEGLVHRARYISDAQPAFELFQENYEQFRSAYGLFFPALQKFSLEKFSDIH